MFELFLSSCFGESIRKSFRVGLVVNHNIGWKQKLMKVLKNIGNDQWVMHGQNDILCKRGYKYWAENTNTESIKAFCNEYW